MKNKYIFQTKKNLVTPALGYHHGPNEKPHCQSLTFILLNPVTTSQ